MPIYEVLTVEGTLDDGQRERIADGIIRAHIEETGAPGELVHCAFSELKTGHMFTNYEPSRTSAIRVVIRMGRSEDVRERLMNRINDLYLKESGVPVQTVVVGVGDFPAKWAMEGGYILPDPNQADEDEWLAKIRGDEATATA